MGVQLDDWRSALDGICSVRGINCGARVVLIVICEMIDLFTIISIINFAVSSTPFCYCYKIFHSQDLNVNFPSQRAKNLEPTST